MGILLSYSIASAIILALLYLVYKLTMSGERQPALNRIIIGGIYAVSLLGPLAYPALRDMVTSNDATLISVGAPVGGIIGESDLSPDGSIPGLRPLLIIYIVGVAISLGYLIFSICQLSRIIRKCEIIDYDEHTIAVSPENRISPFSWLGYIVMSREDYQKEHETVITHEAAHISHMHSIDMIFSQILACFQWFNPAAWLMSEELSTVHKYEADDAVINSGANIRQYQLLLIKKAVGTRFPSPANSLNQSKIKKRITMMYKSRPTSARRLRALALVPALAAGLFIIETPTVAATLSETYETTLLQKSDSKVTKNSAETDSLELPIFYASREEIESPEADQTKASRTNTQVYNAVEKLAEFPGGQEGLMKFLINNVRYPEEAQKKNQQGKVVVKFIVTKNGKITDPMIIKGVCESLDNEALRVIKAMPNWIPAQEKGKKVNSWFSLPISFRLNNNPDK